MPKEVPHLVSPDTVLAKRYKILNLIKEGGMGALYLALDSSTKKNVAVKQLAGTFENEEERRNAISNFITEMGVMKRLRHPQIPKILDHFVEPAGFFFILDYIEGENLTRLLEKNGRQGFPEAQVIEIGIQVCHVLSYLHEQKIIHRDIKPSNLVYLESNRKVMLIDFGISRANYPKSGFMMGTPGYMAPEQNQTIQSDIYSLGATLHELSTGKRPESFYFEPPHQMNPELSEPFSDVVMKALSFEPKDRYPDVKTLEEALQALLSEPIHASGFSDFEEACDRYYKKFLLPELIKIQAHLPNESRTDEFPEHLSHLVFTIGHDVPYSLIIETHPETNDLTFSFKEGLLSPKLIGRFSPFDPETQSQKFLDQFLQFHHKGK